MDWTINGRLAGACNCGTPCPCWFDQEPTHGSCDAIGIGIADEGHYGTLDLTGCKFGVAYRTVRRLWDGGLQVAVYIDDAVPPPQSEALERILTGKAGGLPALLFTLVESFKGVRRVPIELDDAGERPALTLGRSNTFAMRPVIGHDGQNPIEVHNAKMSFGGARLLAQTEGRFVDTELAWEWPLAHADFGPLSMSSNI